MTQWLKKAKITVVSGALALVLVGTSFQGIGMISPAEASVAPDAELISGSVDHDQDAKRRGKHKDKKDKKKGKHGGNRFQNADSGSSFGLGGRRWRGD